MYNLENKLLLFTCTKICLSYLFQLFFLLFEVEEQMSKKWQNLHFGIKKEKSNYRFAEPERERGMGT